jgi:hypothetical protein
MRFIRRRFSSISPILTSAAEMLRIMKPGAIAFVCTPFMQPFHGYPSHYQNFTLFGHRRLFERAGFAIIESGSCVGPAWAMADTMSVFLTQYAPPGTKWLARRLWALIALLFVRPLDRWLAEREDAHVVASTTYVPLERRPAGPQG